MPATATPGAARSALVLRPRHGAAARDCAFAHVDGLVMRVRGPGLPTAAGDLDPIGPGECGRTPRHERFRLTAQIDDRAPDAYAIRHGYAAVNGAEIFTPADLAWAGPSLRRLAAGMERLAAREGRTEDLAETALRLARVLRLDAIAVLDVPAPGDWLRPGHPVLSAGATARPAAVLDGLRAVVARLHADCARRARRAGRAGRAAA